MCIRDRISYCVLLWVHIPLERKLYIMLNMIRLNRTKAGGRWRLPAYLFLFSLLFLNLSSTGQILDPVDWEFSATQDEGDQYILTFSAKIDEGWKVYGMDLDEGGPVPTSIFFDDSSAFEFAGEWKQLGRKKEFHDPIFDMQVTAFEKKAIFRIPVKVSGATEIKGFVEFMSCDDSQCLPPAEEEFSLSIMPAGLEAPAEDAQGGLLEPVKWNISSRKDGKDYIISFKASIMDGWKLYSQHLEEGGPIPTEFVIEDWAGTEALGVIEEVGKLNEAEEPLFNNMVLRWFKDEVSFEQRVSADGKEKVKGFLTFMTCDHKQCLTPTTIDFEVDLASGKNLLADGAVVQDGECRDLELANVDVESETESKGYLIMFLLGLGGGLIALLTPCVFPMIPMTVTFFTKGSGDRAKGIRDAVLYGLSIMLIYGLCGVPFVLGIVPNDILNNIATNPVLNILFFVIFVVFAISFWGYFEITLPSSLANKADAASQRGGLIGIFFMALTLALVSFSCTGPILGGITVSSLQGDATGVHVLSVLLGFGFGLGFPFALLALFPAWLKNLPSSGGWLDTTKKVLGFVEFGLAIKFLSNADLVMNWGLILRETFLIFWILTCLALVLNLAGILKLPHDPAKVKFAPVRVGIMVMFLGFAAYLTPGVFGKNLALISGFPPPMFYSYAQGWGKSTDQLADSDEATEVFYVDTIYMVQGKKITVRDSGEEVTDEDLRHGILEAKIEQEHCPVGIPCFHDIETGFAYAKLVNKPPHLDFTGWACVNCRRMEENVWVDPEVNRMLSEDFVLISLYVDEKKELPEDEKFVSCQFNKKIKTVGDKWANLQAVNFNVNAQPYYVILSPEGHMLAEPTGFTSKEKYMEFLQTGLENFNNDGTVAKAAP